MIEKLKGREMIRVSLVAKKLNEVIDNLNDDGENNENKPSNS